MKLLKNTTIGQTEVTVLFMQETTLKNMYIQYHGLGQNGVIDDLYERIFDLSTEKSIKEKEC